MATNTDSVIKVNAEDLHKAIDKGLGMVSALRHELDRADRLSVKLQPASICQAFGLHSTPHCVRNAIEHSYACVSLDMYEAMRKERDDAQATLRIVRAERDAAIKGRDRAWLDRAPSKQAYDRAQQAADKFYEQVMDLRQRLADAIAKYDAADKAMAQAKLDCHNVSVQRDRLNNVLTSVSERALELEQQRDEARKDLATMTALATTNGRNYQAAMRDVVQLKAKIERLRGCSQPVSPHAGVCAVCTKLRRLLRALRLL